MKYQKTVIRFEVLHDEPIPGHADLEYIARGCMEGRYVGRGLESEETLLTPKQMADALYEAGSEPGFFELDDEGKNIED